MSNALLFFLVAAAGGFTASITGFGIGSILTPVMATKTSMKLAVAAVAIPHVLGTAARCWTLRRQVDRRLLWSFGMISAAASFVGALLQERAGSREVTAVFGSLLIFAGLTGITGVSVRLRFGRATAWSAGAVSGFLGGLVGNQGSIRSAAMLAFDVPPQQFVATATAIGLLVDAARLPIYIAREHVQILALRLWVGLAAAGVLAGTALGIILLRRIPEKLFRKIVSTVILGLGVYTFTKLRH